MGIFNKFHSTIRPNIFWYRSMSQRIVTVCHCSHVWPLRLTYNWSKNINTDKDITPDKHMVNAVSSSLHPLMLVYGWLSPTDWLTTTKFPYTLPPMIKVPSLYTSLSYLLRIMVINSIFVLFRETFVTSLVIFSYQSPYTLSLMLAPLWRFTMSIHLALWLLNFSNTNCYWLVNCSWFRYNDA